MVTVTMVVSDCDIPDLVESILFELFSSGQPERKSGHTQVFFCPAVSSCLEESRRAILNEQCRP